MSLNDVFAALNRHLSGGSIDLYAAAQAEPIVLAGLAANLQAYAIRAAFTLTQAALTPPGTNVRLVGQGNYGLGDPATRPPVTATLDVTDSGALQFVLRFEYASGRTGLATLFPNLLPDYEQLQANQSVKLVRSFLYDLGLRQLRLEANTAVAGSVAASGLLDAEGVLLQYKALLPGWPLNVAGSIEMPRAGVANDVVALELIGIDRRVQIPFFNNQLTDVGFALSAVRDLDPASNQYPAISALELIGSLTFASNPPVRLRVPLTASGDTWRLIADLPAGWATIGNAVAALAGLLGLSPDQLLQPIDFIGLDVFYLATVEVAFAPPKGALPSIDLPVLTAHASFAPSLRWLAITVRSDKTWTPPIPFVSVDRVGARWVVTWPGGKLGSIWGGSVFGGLTLGPKTGTDSDFTLDVSASLPQFVVTGNLRHEVTLPIGDAISHFIGSGTPDTPPGMSLSRFWFSADPNARTFSAEAAIDMNWNLSPFQNVVFDLVGLNFFVDVQQSSVSGGIAASIQLDDRAASNGLYPTLTVSARGERAQGQSSWTFEGGLLPGAPLSLTRIALRLLDVDASQWQNFPDLAIDTLNFSVQTGEAGMYSADGSASLRWTPQILGTTLRISVQAGAKVTKPAKTEALPNPTASGTVSGSFALNQLALTLGFDFGVPNPTWRFRVQFGKPWVELTTYTTTDSPPHRILTAQLGGVTLGSILEYLVNLAAPTLGYKLDSPWDALNRVDLSRFLLSLDLSTSTVSLTMNLPIDLGVMQINTLSIKYTRGAGLSGVELVLDGKFFGQDKKLGWDVVRDPPPAVPGKGGAAVDLYYLALGQRVRPTDDTPNTVRKYLDSLEKAMQPLPPGGSSPPPIGNGVSFAADSEWLIGLDIDLAETFRLGLLFNDPRLYGLSIALRGPKAGSFDGLDFQLLYKKISDSIGMFRIDLTLPIAMRSYTFGPVGLTLGVIALEIYTNGNFTVDFGYPWKRDFSRAFTVQYFPFIGRGGIYFGYLSGATSSRVPKITDGTFDPVIELGVGLAVGVGKEIVLGPLSGGAYVQIEVVFLGVFGWFNPSDHARKPAAYFWAQATAAIVGKVYGTVDFKIIKVSITLLIEAEASVIFEVYRAAKFHVSVRVTAEAEIKILFIKISFSFSVGVALDFTAGSDSATPWTLASGQGTQTSRVFLRRSLERRLRALGQQQRHLQRQRGRLLAAGDYWLDFDPQAPIFADGQRTLALHMIPSFTLSDLPISWTGAAPVNGAPAWRIALLLTAETGVDPKAATPAQRAQRSGSLHAADASEQPAQLIAEAFLRWALYAVTHADASSSPGLVTALQLQQLADQLDLPQAADDAFTLLNLSNFFVSSLKWQIAGDPGGEPDTLDALLLPLPPPLILGWDQPVAGSRTLNDFNLIGAQYIADVAAYQQHFQPLAPKDASGANALDDSLEAFATHAFRDWCLMLTKTVVKAARDGLDQASVVLTAPASLDDVAARFPTLSVQYLVVGNDTLIQVAQAVGASVAEIQALNPDLAQTLATTAPGKTVPVLLGVAAALIAHDNPDVNLKPGVYALGSVHASVREGDSFSGIAARFGLATAGALGNANLYGDVKLLGAGRLIAAPAASYTFAVDVAAGLGAAVLFARWFESVAVDESDWYAQTLALWNSAALQGLSPDGTIAPGTPLKVPAAYLDSAAPPAQPNYTSLAGDTPRRIGTALALLQLYGAGSTLPAPAGWNAFRSAVQQNGRNISLPAAAIAIAPGETLSALGLRTLLHTTPTDIDGPGLLNWLGTSPVLAPLTLIEVVGAQVDTSKFASFSAISSALGLNLTDIGSALADVPGLLPAKSEAPLTLTIAAVPVQSIETVVSDTLAGTGVADIAGQMSRQTLSGLRLPAPVKDEHGVIRATGPMTAFADLTGQQIVGPQPGSGIDPASGISISVERNGSVPWIEFVAATIAGANGGAADLLARHPAAAALNPALATRAAANASIAAGSILRTDVLNSLSFIYSAADLQARYPASNLALTPISGPEALPLSTLAPESFGLEHAIALQAASPLALPGGESALTGQPQLYPFPDALRALAHAGGGDLFEVVLGAPSDSAGGKPQILPDATFVAAVKVRIVRGDVDLPVYTLVGSDADGRTVLLDLVAHLGSGALAYLAVAPDPAAAAPNGLAVLDLKSASDAFLIKTNQSTASVPDSVQRSLRTLAAQTDAPQPLLTADLSNPAAFAQLLFEGSVVGGTGYFLSLTQRDGSGIAPGAFDSEGRAELWFVVLSAAAQQPAPNGRELESFVNAALLAPGSDSSARSLSVIAANDALGSAVASVPPGHAGFRVLLPNPRSDANLAAVAPTDIHQLYGLVDYQLGKPGAVYDAGLPGLAIYPRNPDESSWTGQRQLLRRRLKGLAAPAPLVAPDWSYTLVLPIYRYAGASLAPAVPGLPDATQDPYRGLGGASTRPQAEFAVGVRDVLGNSSLDSDAAPVPVDIGYTDPLLGPDAWPATRLSFVVSGSAPAGQLAYRIDPLPANAWPALGEDAANARERAGKQAERYAAAWYQWSQSGLTVSSDSSLYGSTGARPWADGPGALWSLAGAQYLYTQALAQLQPVQPAFAEAQTLAALSTRFGYSVASLANGNESLSARSVLLAQSVPMPGYVLVQDGDSAVALSARTPKGVTPPGASVLLADPNNAARLPLRAGTLLSITPRSISVPASAPTAPLAEFADELGTSVAQLGLDNADRAILRVGFVFSIDGVDLTVNDQPGNGTLVRNFNEASAAYADLGVQISADQLADAVQDSSNLLAIGVTLNSSHYLVPAATQDAPFETLAVNGSGRSVAALAQLNTGTLNLFDSGALVYVGDYSVQPSVGDDDDATLAEWTARFGASPTQLLQRMDQLAVALPQGSALSVPGMLAWPDSAPRIAAIVPAAITVADLVACFDYGLSSAAAVAQFVSDQLPMPHLLNAGISVRVDFGGNAYSTDTQADDTLASVLARLRAQNAGIDITALAAGIAGQSSLLRSGALLATPPALLAAETSNTDVAVRYGLPADAIAAANIGLRGALLAGAVVVAAEVSETLSADDSWNAVLARFAEQGVEVDLAALIAANPSVSVYRSGALLLLPAAAVVRTEALSAASYAEPVFALGVALQCTRPQALIDPAFTGSSVETVRSQFQPLGGDADADARLALASNLRAALPTLRLASGQVADSDADLWLINFGSDGISSVNLSAGAAGPDSALWPRYYALRPLYPTLISRSNVALPVVQADGSIKDSSNGSDFVGIDVETWARRFLADVDRVLAGPQAVALYSDPIARGALNTILLAKQQLVEGLLVDGKPLPGTGIASGLAPVLTIQSVASADARAAAADALTQALGINLSSAYASAGVVQYDSSANTWWTRNLGALGARLYGDGQPDPASPVAYTLSSARIDLAASRGYAQFVLGVDNVSEHKAIAFKPTFIPTHLEWNIEPVSLPGASGYESSNWLTLIPAFTTTVAPAALQIDLGDTQAPIPLRAFPALPSVQGQSAGPSYPENPTLAQIGLWTYGFRYRHEHAAQDELVVALRFNQTLSQLKAGLAAGPDVATALARYQSVADTLFGLIAGLGGSQNARAAQAALSLASLMNAVAPAWAGHFSQPSNSRARVVGAAPESVYWLDIQLAYSADGQSIVGIDVTRLPDPEYPDQGPTPPGPDGAWPILVYRGPDGVDHPLQAQTPAAGSLSCHYQFVGAPPASAQWAEIEVSYADLSVAQWQNAIGSVSVVRNRSLITGLSTDNAFVYASARVQASNAITPLLRSSDTVDIHDPQSNIVSTPIAALVDAMQTLFGQSPNGLPLALGIGYGYEFAAGLVPGSALETVLPVHLLPRTDWEAGVASALDQAIADWKGLYQPATEGGFWAFSLTLYSSLESSASPPLLAVERLAYRLT